MRSVKRSRFAVTVFVRSKLVNSVRIPVGTFQLPGSRKICISFGVVEVEIRKPESWRNSYSGVDLNTTRFVLGWFSCTNSPPSCTWRNVMDGYNRNVLSLPKYHIRICRAFRNLGATHCSKHARFTLFEKLLGWIFYSTYNSVKTRPLELSAKWWNGNRSWEFNLGLRNSVLRFPRNVKWKQP